MAALDSLVDKMGHYCMIAWVLGMYNACTELCAEEALKNICGIGE